MSLGLEGGTIFGGRYWIIRRLAAGAMGAVYEAAHVKTERRRASIVHRDLKPGNLFLTERPGREPTLKVLDFGVAKVVSESATGGGGTVRRGDAVLHGARAIP